MKYKYEKIREIREKNKYTQQQIADELKLHLTQYRRYETGEREIPVHILIDLCKLYNVSSDYILGLTDECKSLK